MDADISSMTTEEKEKLLLDLTFKETDKDDVINRKIDFALSLARKGGYDDKKKEWDVADKLMDGDHESLVWEGTNQKKAEYKSDTVLNLVFPAVRNQAGLMTDQRPKPEALPAPADNEEDFKSRVERAKTVEKALSAKWEEKKIQEKLPEACVQQTLYADTFFHPFWNYYEDDIDVELVPPQNLLFEPHALSIDEADWAIYRKVKTPAWLRKHFDLKDDFFDPKDMLYGDDKEIQTDKKQIENGIAVDEVYTDDVLIIRAGKKILKKGKNPLFEWLSVEEQQQEFMQKQLGAFAEQGIEPDPEQMAAIQSQFVPITNFFDQPRKPFVQLKSVNDGKSLYSKGVMKQLRSVVMTINQRKQQVDDNANNMANLKIFYDSSEMSEEEVAKVSNMPGSINAIRGLSRNPNMLLVPSVSPLPQYVIEDMMHSQRIFDDIFGLHEVSRGAKAVGKQTATQVNRQVEADQTVVRLLVRQLEAATCEVYRWWVQLMKLFYTEEKMIRIVGANETYEYFGFSAADIDDGIDIKVTPGSTLPVNKEARRQEDIMLAQGQMLAPIDLFESLEKANPEKLAQNLALWQQGQTPGMPQPVGQDPEQENQMMMQGQPVEAKPEDDHQGHMQAHMAILQEAGDQLPPEIIQIFEEHLSMHDKMMAETMGPGGQGQPAMMGGGMPGRQ